MILSDRENDIATLIGKGFTDKEIARVLGIAVNTVKAHKQRLFKKIGIERRGGVTEALAAKRLELRDRMCLIGELMNR